MHFKTDNLCFSADDEDELFQQQQSSEVKQSETVYLQNFTEDTRTTYLNEDSPAGIYSIIFIATDTDSTVRIHATTTPFSDQPYPALPSDNSVKVMSVSTSTVTLAWKPSPTQSSLHQELEYCVSVNKRQNFGTLCAAEAFIFGENPPTPPPNAGFGFSWEKEKQTEFQKKARPKPAADPHEAFYSCIGSKTTFTFLNAIPGHQYFFDVFVVNKQQNMTSAYKGTNATTEDHSKEIALKDGKVHLAFLKRTRPQRTFTYDLDRPTNELLFVIKPCSGRLQIEIANEDRVVESLKIKEFTQVRIANPKIGSYRLEIASDKSRTASFHVLVTSDSSKDPYPKLPNNTQIQVSNSLQRCRSVTLAWMGTAKRQRYCLYMHRYGPSQMKKRHKDLSSCSGPHTRKKADKVLCRNFRARNKRRSVMRETVRGLKPDTTYMFDVYVQKPGGQSLGFQRVLASTSSSC